jgi:hypothetical protein
MAATPCYLDELRLRRHEDLNVALSRPIKQGPRLRQYLDFHFIRNATTR